MGSNTGPNAFNGARKDVVWFLQDGRRASERLKDEELERKLRLGEQIATKEKTIEKVKNARKLSLDEYSNLKVYFFA